MLPVTEDTPVDMLAGAMDVKVVLPNSRCVSVRVERSTPMMDLLVQLTTKHKLSLSGHTTVAVSDHGNHLHHLPSTPIGALDTRLVHVVPRNTVAAKRIPMRPNTIQPFLTTFRLQVHLPRNQLFVSRVSPDMLLSDVLSLACAEKNLEPSKYELRHPANLQEKLSLSHTLADYGLQEVTIVAARSLGSNLTPQDIMALHKEEEKRRQQVKATGTCYNTNSCLNKRNNTAAQSTGSVSSDSLNGRSISPTRSDESVSRSISPPAPQPPQRLGRKRRPAPKPPVIQPESNHSRTSSDSSGYHEASVLSENLGADSTADTLPRRSKLPSSSMALSRSLSNLNTSMANTFSTSTMSLASRGVLPRKKKAPPPPPVVPAMAEQNSTATVALTTSSVPVLSTTVPINMSAPLEETTALLEETTVLPVKTTAVSEETTAVSEETTAVSEETAAVSEETAAVSEETAAVPVNTMAPLEETIVLPVITTVVPCKTAAPLDKTAVVPVKTAAPPDKTAVVPEETITVRNSISVPVTSATVLEETTAVQDETTNVPARNSISLSVTSTTEEESITLPITTTTIPIRPTTVSIVPVTSTTMIEQTATIPAATSISGNHVASVPVTSVPVTSVPVTSVPAAYVPVTTVPAAYVPVTTVPAACVPVTPVPVAYVPVTTVPVTTVPVITVPVASVTDAYLPVTTLPAASVALLEQKTTAAEVSTSDRKYSSTLLEDASSVINDEPDVDSLPLVPDDCQKELVVARSAVDLRLAETLPQDEEEGEEDSSEWQYHLPAPPSAFRDSSASPSATEFETVVLADSQVFLPLDSEPRLDSWAPQQVAASKASVETFNSLDSGRNRFAPDQNEIIEKSKTLLSRSTSNDLKSSNLLKNFSISSYDNPRTVKRATSFVALPRPYSKPSSFQPIVRTKSISNLMSGEDSSLELARPYAKPSFQPVARTKSISNLMLEEETSVELRKSGSEVNISQPEPPLQSLEVLKQIMKDNTELNNTTTTSSSPTSKPFVYTGPPAINFGTWSQRAKVQVAIKSDQDYRSNNNNVLQVNRNAGNKPTYIQGQEPKLPVVSNKPSFVQAREPKSTFSNYKSSYIQSQEPKSTFSINKTSYIRPEEPKSTFTINKSTFNRPEEPKSTFFNNKSTFSINKPSYVQAQEPKSAFPNNKSTNIQPQEPKSSFTINKSTYLRYEEPKSIYVAQPVIVQEQSLQPAKKIEPKPLTMRIVSHTSDKRISSQSEQEKLPIVRSVELKRNHTSMVGLNAPMPTVKGFRSSEPLKMINGSAPEMVRFKKPVQRPIEHKFTNPRDALMDAIRKHGENKAVKTKKDIIQE